MAGALSSISVSEFFLSSSSPPQPSRRICPVPSPSLAVRAPHPSPPRLPPPPGTGLQRQKPLCMFLAPCLSPGIGGGLWFSRVFFFFTSQHCIQDKLWLTVSAKGEGFLCVPGALPRERHLVSPPLSPSHPTPLTRWVTCVGCWSGWGGGRQPAPSGEAGRCPLWVRPWVSQWRRMFHFSPGAVSQAFFPALSFSPSVCLNSLLHRVRGLWSSLDWTN